MTVRELREIVRKEYQMKSGERFFSEKALLSALFEKNGLDRDLPLLAPQSHISAEKETAFLSDLEQLLSGYPIQYYLGSEWFCGEEFETAPGVLIPRPETECLVELGVKYAPQNGLVFDFCCGSGCVGIALLKKRPDLRCLSFDLSEDALCLTRKNCARFGLEDRMTVEKLDVLSGGAKERILREKPSLILSNPPYLTSSEMLEIEENVKNEPSLALYGGEDGLMFYRPFLALSKETGVPFLCEMGYGQKEGVENLLSELLLRGEFFRDQSGQWRNFMLFPER